MKSIKSTLTALLLLAGFASMAEASPTNYNYNLDLTFADGAQFFGLVTFNNTLTSIVGLTGTLDGYVDGNLGYLGHGTDSVSLLSGGLDVGTSIIGATVADVPFLVNIGTVLVPVYLSEVNVLTLDFSLLNPNSVALIDIGLGTGLGGAAGVIIPSQSSITPTPEPGSILLLGSGLAALAMLVRRRAIGAQAMALSSC